MVHVLIHVLIRVLERRCATWRTLLGKSIGPISLTIDMWSNDKAVTFKGLTAHFVTTDAEIGKHDGPGRRAINKRRVLRQLDAILRKFGIHDNIGNITIDDGCSMVLAMEDLAFPTATARPIVFR